MKHELFCNCSDCMNAGGGDKVPGAGVVRQTGGGALREKHLATERRYAADREARRGAK